MMSSVDSPSPQPTPPSPTPRPMVKVCGFTTAGDVELAIALGVDWLGLIFVPGTPRTVTMTAVQTIAQVARLKGRLVGVFQNQPLALVNELATLLPLHAVQLHGEESPEYCAQIDRPVIKVFSLKAPPDEATLLAYAPHIAYALYDWPKGDPTPIEWATLSFLPALLHPPFPTAFLAGRLTADQLPALWDRFAPAGFDVASGVESSPGVKDPDLMRAFVATCQGLLTTEATP
jgi:phosphoribosylanthranilate isomerase